MLGAGEGAGAGPSLFDDILNDCERLLSPSERSLTLRRIRASLADVSPSEEPDERLIGVMLLLSSPLGRPCPKPDPLTPDLLLRLWRAHHCSVLLAHLVYVPPSVLWSLFDDPDVTLPSSFHATVLRARLLRALFAGRPVARPELARYAALASHVGSSSLIQGLDASRAPPLRCRFDGPPGRPPLRLAWRGAFGDLSETLWPAALVLAELVARRVVDCRGLRVAELGAGVGLAGIAAASWGEAQHCVLTDYDTGEGLRLLESNLRSNGLAPDVASTAFLDWCRPPSQVQHVLRHPQVVLLADCWYSAVLPLASHQASLVATLLSSSPATVCWSSCARRGDGAVEAFIEAFRAAGLAVEERPLPVLAITEAYFPSDSPLELAYFRISSVAFTATPELPPT